MCFLNVYVIEKMGVIVELWFFCMIWVFKSVDRVKEDSIRVIMSKVL